jgi:hypothetical protein
MIVEMKVMEEVVQGQVLEVQVGQVANITIQHLSALCQEEYNKQASRRHLRRMRVTPKWMHMMTVKKMMIQMMVKQAVEEAGMRLLIHQGV